VAQAVGVSVRAIEQLEAEDEASQNPTIVHLRRLASVLRTSVPYLADAVQPRPEETNDTLRRSKITFDQYVQFAAATVPEATVQWQRYVNELETNLSRVDAARAEPPTIDEWRKRFENRGSTQPALFADSGED
jgi:transcriptional regulator with XRE-family HTH domain